MSEDPTAKDVGLAVRELDAAGTVVHSVFRPSSESELQQIMDQANREGRIVLPLGGGTALGVGVVPERIDIALDMTGLARVKELDVRNMNITVQAGMTVDAVNEHLRKAGRGLFLPLDPPLSHRATIGGVYASNASGPSRLLYGTLRDQILGISAVDAAGRELKFGGLTVKNVSGYDLAKFFIGSAGSLCVITGVSFRVYPIPEASCLCEIVLNNEQEIQKLLEGLWFSQLIPMGVVVTDESSNNGCSVLVAFEGHPAAVERQHGDFMKMAEGHGALGMQYRDRETMMKRLRQALDPDDSRANDLTLKVSVAISQGMPAYTAVSRISKDLGLKTKISLQAGNGVLYVYASGDKDKELSSLVKELRNIATSLNGHVIPIKAPYTILSEWGPRFSAGLERYVLRPIKEKLDPKGILLPVA